MGGYHVAMNATNCQITNVRNDEQWCTTLVATKCMGTGRDLDRARNRINRGDFTVSDGLPADTQTYLAAN